MEIAEALSQAELYIRHHQTAEARTILGEIIREDPKNEEAWILSAQVSDKPEQVLFCLHRAIEINPLSSHARILLDKLQQTYPSSSSGSFIPTVPGNEERTGEDKTISEQPSDIPEAAPKPEAMIMDQPGPQAIPSPIVETEIPEHPHIDPVGAPPPVTESPERLAPATAATQQNQPPSAQAEFVHTRPGPADQLRGQVEVRKRPMRWLQRIFYNRRNSLPVSALDFNAER